MAIVKPTPADKREVNLSLKIKLPRNRYTLRIKNEEFKMSAGGNPMIVLSTEFVAPDKITAGDGSTVNIAGQELNKHYITLRVKDKSTGEIDVKKSQAAFDRYADLRASLGVPVPDEGIDIENPDKVLQGKIIDAICDGEEYAQRQDPTPEQKAKGEMGSVIRDAQGNELKGYRSIIVSILGEGDSSVGNSPFSK